MHPIVAAHLDALHALCPARRVGALHLFGSALGGDFDPARSDLDCLVEFEPMTARERGGCYSGLLADLERLFARSIDLAEPDGIRNRLIRAAIDRTKAPLYAAA